jgi:hypothetical protein
LEFGREERFPNPKLSDLFLIVIFCHIRRNDKLAFVDMIFPRRFVNVIFFVGLRTDKEIVIVNLSVIAFDLYRLWFGLLGDMTY